MLESFFQWMSWPMETPPSYGAFHILFTLIGFTLCSFAAWKLRKVTDQTANRILLGCGSPESCAVECIASWCYIICWAERSPLLSPPVCSTGTGS